MTRRMTDSEKIFRVKPITTPEQFASRTARYFDQCKEEDKQPTINGLALVLGINGKDGFKELEQREEFRDVVRVAKTYICAGYEEHLPNRTKVIGAIFALKQFGWTDKDPAQEAANDIAAAMTAAIKKVNRGRKDKQEQAK